MHVYVKPPHGTFRSTYKETAEWECLCWAGTCWPGCGTVCHVVCRDAKKVNPRYLVRCPDCGERRP